MPLGSKASSTNLLPVLMPIHRVANAQPVRKKPVYPHQSSKKPVIVRYATAMPIVLMASAFKSAQVGDVCNLAMQTPVAHHRHFAQLAQNPRLIACQTRCYVLRCLANKIAIAVKARSANKASAIFGCPISNLLLASPANNTHNVAIKALAKHQTDGADVASKPVKAKPNSVQRALYAENYCPALANAHPAMASAKSVAKMTADVSVASPVKMAHVTAPMAAA